MARKYFKKRLPNCKETKEFLESLPTMYIVACWAYYGTDNFPFTGRYEIRDGISVPMVYYYYDCNGTRDEWILGPITNTTSAGIVCWTEKEKIANRIAEALNKAEGV